MKLLFIYIQLWKLFCVLEPHRCDDSVLDAVWRSESKKWSRRNVFFCLTIQCFSLHLIILIAAAVLHVFSSFQWLLCLNTQLVTPVNNQVISVSDAKLVTVFIQASHCFLCVVLLWCWDGVCVCVCLLWCVCYCVCVSEWWFGGQPKQTGTTFVA